MTREESHDALLGTISSFSPLSRYPLTFNSAASVIAANTLLRSFAGGAFPLFAVQMFNNLGIQWAGTLLGCLAAIMIPIPIAFYIYGPKLRRKSKFTPTGEESPSSAEESGSRAENEEIMM